MIQNATSYSIAPLEFLVGKYLPDFKGSITVKTDDALLGKFSGGGYEIQALLDRNRYAPFYILAVRSDVASDIDHILCHEFCHLCQMEAGRLSLDMATRVFTWEGKRYSGAYPYMSRPWEVEACRMEITYLKEFRASQKPRKCLFTTHK